jgi:DNA helicase-4
VVDAQRDTQELRTSSVVWRLFSSFLRTAAPQTAMRLPDGILFVSRKSSRLVRYRDVRRLSLRRGLLGRRLVIESTEAVQTLRGLRAGAAQRFFDLVRNQWILDQRRMLDEWQKANRASIEFVESLSDPRRYVRQSNVASHRQSLSEPLKELLQRSFTELGEHPLLPKLPLLQQFTFGDEELVSAANEVFVVEERSRYQNLFETIESNPLTAEQQVAVVTDEDRNLVVAAAGSGKTSVIIAKVAHILKQGDIHPSQLLVLAFNRAARDELRSRIAAKVDVPSIEEASVMTFHGLGYSIIGAARKAKPSVARHAGELWKAAQLIREIIDALCSDDPHFEQHLSEWFAWHLHQYKSAFDFETLGEYYEYLEQNKIITLKGESVKSFEECMIANFLALKGVDYEYEAPYEHPTADEKHRQYQPDFFLPGHQVYIEHFGIDREGHTAPFVNESEYHASIKWKRNLHRSHETDLIETFSYQRREGRLLSSLEEALLERGITFAPVSAKERLDQLRSSSVYDEFSNLIAVFLGHFISNGEDRSAVLERSRRSSDTERAAAFLRIFWPVREYYEQRMATENEIDFEIMVRDATDLVEAGRYASPYRYILVDEFQDISVGRARLLRALCEQHAENQLFAVGDDWQSIYRFAGSDISVMRNFREYFGPTARSDLSTTFRCNQEIADLSSKFIRRNPSQLSKEVNAVRERNRTAVFLWRYPAQGEAPVAAALQRIQEEAPSASVLVLGRYRHNRPVNWHRLASASPTIGLKFQTVHSAKGLEADYVIVLGLAAGMYGFPSEIEDDPLMELVLAEQERFEHAEERRLLYVAVTRAKHAAFLMAPEPGESAFIRELEGPGYFTITLGTEPASLARCPNCVSGLLSLRTGKNGNFVGCSNYPRCTFTTGTCPTCRVGVVNLRPGVGICTTCRAEVELCPKCLVGYLLQRRGQYGAFWGCSSYPACRYTRAREAS